MFYRTTSLHYPWSTIFEPFYFWHPVPLMVARLNSSPSISIYLQPKPSLLPFPEISNDFILSLSALHLVTLLFYSLSDLSFIWSSFREDLWTTKQESFLKFLIKTLKATTKTVLFLNEAFAPFSQNGITKQFDQLRLKREDGKTFANHPTRVLMSKNKRVGCEG